MSKKYTVGPLIGLEFPGSAGGISYCSSTARENYEKWMKDSEKMLKDLEEWAKDLRKKIKISVNKT